jgi:hypothetical protein
MGHIVLILSYHWFLRLKKESQGKTSKGRQEGKKVRIRIKIETTIAIGYLINKHPWLEHVTSPDPYK